MTPSDKVHRRWAVRVSHWHYGRPTDGSPFLAGRGYFGHEDRDDLPQTATFETREGARRRARGLRTKPGRRDWRTTARAVRVNVSISEAR